MKLAYETITAEQNSYSFFGMKSTTVWTELNEIIGSIYQSDNPIQHLAIASWAEDRQPPFGTGKNMNS